MSLSQRAHSDFLLGGWLTAADAHEIREQLAAFDGVVAATDPTGDDALVSHIPMPVVDRLCSTMLARSFDDKCAICCGVLPLAGSGGADVDALREWLAEQQEEEGAAAEAAAAAAAAAAADGGAAPPAAASFSALWLENANAHGRAAAEAGGAAAAFASVAVTPCGHLFHVSCLDAVFSAASASSSSSLASPPPPHETVVVECPICRASVAADGVVCFVAVARSLRFRWHLLAKRPGFSYAPTPIALGAGVVDAKWGWADGDAGHAAGPQGLTPFPSGISKIVQAAHAIGAVTGYLVILPPHNAPAFYAVAPAPVSPLEGAFVQDFGDRPWLHSRSGGVQQQQQLRPAHGAATASWQLRLTAPDTSRQRRIVEVTEDRARELLLPQQQKDGDAGGAAEAPLASPPCSSSFVAIDDGGHGVRLRSDHAAMVRAAARAGLPYVFVNTGKRPLWSLSFAEMALLRGAAAIAETIGDVFLVHIAEMRQVAVSLAVTTASPSDPNALLRVRHVAPTSETTPPPPPAAGSARDPAFVVVVAGNQQPQP